MSGFTFNAPRRVICRAGAIQDLGGIAKTTIGSPLLIVTDPGVCEAGLLAPVKAALDEAGVEFAVFAGVQADPPDAVVLAATESALNIGAVGVIGLGGGSSMDVAKLVALLARGNEQLADIYGVDKVTGDRLPLIQIPTTAGTGSEVTPVAIVTVGKSEKKGVVSPCLLPDVALLDARLTLGLPAPVTAATGVDAMVHAIEAYTSRNPNNNPVSAVLALQALSLLGRHIKTAVHDGSDLQAREGMLLGAMLAGQAFANSPVAAVHALAYPLGGRYHLPHGLSNALVLAHVMRFNRPVCAGAYARLATQIFPELAAYEDKEARCDALIEALAALVEELGIKPRLRDYGISKEALAALAGDAMEQTRLLVNNPRELSEADALAIYGAAW
ncbi:iron-containing alcohol dehydrogenase [Granulosicoccaceae sp. 1_MG-2023]|nr:iron-containing alcohol dehydrogenase [Granulosicoccaceae sp. 1_MG-2023]